MERTEILNIINKSNGRIFSAIFIKKDGTIRRMKCRLSVKKGITGKGMAYNPIKRGLLPVFDMDKNAFRMININTLTALKVNGEKYEL